MRTSATFRPTPRSNGFTLLELLVVLAIAGLLASIVLPRLQSIASSVETANQRTDLRLAIEGLGYRAYSTGKPIVLSDSYAGGAPGAAAAPLAVPEGWRVEVPKAITYAVNGACSGGRVVMKGPGGDTEAFDLKPPRCLLQPATTPP